MIRPGRIDTVIPVRPPDANAAARLVQLYGRGLVEGDLGDLEAAIRPLLGSNAAVFREVVERGKLAAVRRLKGDTSGLVIEPADISNAAVTMKEHLELLAPRSNPDDRPMSVFGRAVGRELGRELSTDTIDLAASANGK